MVSIDINNVVTLNIHSINYCFIIFEMARMKPYICIKKNSDLNKKWVFVRYICFLPILKMSSKNTIKKTKKS